MIDPNEFAMMVSEDIKGRKVDSIVYETLRHPSNLQFWKDNLLAILEKVDSQILEMQEEISSLDKYRSENDFSFDPASSIRTRLSKAERFRYHAQKRLAEADRLISSGHTTEDQSLSGFLRKCIEEHKRLKEILDMYDTVDLQLWDALSGKWGFK